MKIRALCLSLLCPLPALAQAPATAPASAPAPAPAAAPAPASAPAPAPAAAPAPVVAPAPLAAPVEPIAPMRLAFFSTSAFGLSNAGFFNQLVGGRFDYRFTRRFAFGAALSYANLKGKDKRVHNVLPEAGIELRVPITGESLGVPLRFSAGFLPQNGPTLRVAAGLDFAFSKALSLEVFPLEPMIWVTRERPEVSMNGSLGLRVTL